MIVDDNENNRYMLEALLQGYGFETISAKNGAEALELAKKKPPVLIITDLLMPVMDGFELCRQWKSDQKLKEIPLIVYTATYTEPKDEKYALSLGADRFVVKPQKTEDIIKLINEFCQFEKEIYFGTYSPQKPLGDEMDELRQYNSVLFSKLEQKMAALQNEVIERKNAESKLAATVESLELSNADIERFSYAAFHDLQEPLRVLSLYAQLLRKKYSTGMKDEAMNYVDTIVRESTRMSGLIKNIIDYSRLGKEKKDFKKVDLNRIAADAVEIYREKVKEQNVEFKYGQLPEVMGSDFELTQLFSNIIGNSLKFVKEGQRPVIEISSSRNAADWEICIKDNGIGISPKYFNKIFVLFQTLHTQEEYEGGGIGLAICKKIVERHGGRIWVESEEGKGTAFCFVLPGIHG
jgi:signal transduction histidine kinase